jgi:mono/diheme cytochrome c family protein
MWSTNRLVVFLALTLGLAIGLGSRTRAQAPGADIWKGVYTSAQAEVGANSYAASCSRCHNPDLSGGQVGNVAAPALGGQNFMSRWQSNNVDRLFHTIRETMPRGTPGILNDESAMNIVAYILKYNGFPSGDTPLTAGSALADLFFVPKDGVIARREVVNFVVVQTVGCLAQGPDQSWMLTGAADPEVARPGASVATKDAPGGSQTFRLVSAGAYSSKLSAGRSVQVRGLFRKDSDGAVINLTDVVALGTECGK